MAELSSQWFHRLKSAQRDLIERCGGIVRASEKCSTSKTEVGRWNNSDDPAIIPLAAALQLEADCGTPIVSAVMAELNGRRLADPDTFGAANATLMAANAEVVVQCGELVAATAMAFSDGKVTPAEASNMDRNAAKLESALAEMRKSIATIRGQGGLSLVAGGAA